MSVVHKGGTHLFAPSCMYTLQTHLGSPLCSAKHSSSDLQSCCTGHANAVFIAHVSMMCLGYTSETSATLQVMFQNRTGKLALVDLYYEWGRGRNANLIHAQQGSTLYDIGAALGSPGKLNRATFLCWEAGVLQSSPCAAGSTLWDTGS